MFGPPERCYGVNESNIPSFTSFSYGQGRGIYVPWRPGTFFYKEGYSNTVWFMQDLLEQVCGLKGIAPGLTPMVETTFASRLDRFVIQLVNITGHYGNSFYGALPVRDISLKVPVHSQVMSVRTLRGKEALPYKQAGGLIEFILPSLNEYEAVVLETGH
jgi:hypothetical protein